MPLVRLGSKGRGTNGMPAKGQILDTVPPTLVVDLSALFDLTTLRTLISRDPANDVCSFLSRCRCSILCWFTRPIELRTTVGPEIPAAGRRQLGWADDGRRRGIRFDRTSLGVHD